MNPLLLENQKLKDEIAVLKNQLRRYTEKEKSVVRMEELKDIYFAHLLSVAVDNDKNEIDILKIMTYGVKRVIGKRMEAALFHLKPIGSDPLERLISHEGTLFSELVSHKKALYCLIDTELGEQLEKLDWIDRYLTLKEKTVLGDTELYGEGIVSTTKINSGRSVKYFRYDDYQPYRFKYLQKNKKQGDKFRVSFPIYHIEEDRIDEIEYILLLRNVGNVPFSNHQIRAIRGYGNYGTLSLSIKQLIKKDREILEKDKKIKEQEAWIIGCIKRYLHNIVTPLSTIENIVGYLDEIMDSAADPVMAKKYSILLTQINKVKHSLQNIRDTISVPKYSLQTQHQLTPAETTDGAISSVELDNFISEYLKTVNLKESYGSRIKFNLQLNAEGILVPLDKTKMSFILDNAIRNTFQAIESGGLEKATFEIKTIYDTYNNTVVLFLKDFAGGLSEEQNINYHIKGNIQTTKTNGTGEGIPTIIDYFKEMGCKDVELRNLPGQGVLYTATFTVAED